MTVQATEEIEAEEAAVVPSERAAQLASLSPMRAAIELAWPSIVEQSFIAAGTAVIFAFVGHLGATAIAGVGAANNFLFLMFPAMRSLTIGTIAIVSRRMGEGRPRDAADASRQSLLLAAIAGVAFSALFFVFAEPLLRILGADGEVLAIAVPFLRLVGAANTFSMVWLIGTAAMRAAGDTRTPMVLSVASIVVSVALAYTFIDVFRLGPMGSAYAQSVTWLLGMLAMLTMLFRGTAGLSVAGGPWRLNTTTIRRIYEVSLPSAAESGTFSLGILTLSGFVFRLGTNEVAAHQIVGQVETFSFFPCIGFSVASGALVGQSLGMGDVARAKATGWASAKLSVIWSVIAGATFAFLPAQLLGLFTNSDVVVAAGIGALAVVGLGQPAQGLLFALGGALRGAGDTRFPLVASLVNWFVVRLPLAYLLAFPFGLGLTGIWLAVTVDYFVRAALMTWRFRSGKWARVRV